MEINSKPNILVIFCDQLRIDLLRCYGGQTVRTPNIDALAKESVVFDNAYTPTAICSPARASFMTGLYPHAHHMFNNSTPGYSYCEHLRPDVTMIQDWADKQTDYETAYFGKWHIGPAQDLFNSNFHHTHPKPYEGGPSFLGSSHWHPDKSLGKLYDSLTGGNNGILDMDINDFPDVRAMRYTKEFLKKRDKDRPFLAYCSFPGPHGPMMIPKEFGVRYDSNKIPIWENRDDDFVGKPLYQKKLNLYENNMDDKTLKYLLSIYFSYMELIDGLVGDLIETLKSLHLYDNTVIVFTADHGNMAGSHGFFSKGHYMYDEIYRIPLIIRDPDNLGRRIGAHVHLMDVTATLLHYMSGQPQKDMGNNTLHGQSMLPLMNGKTESLRAGHYAQYHGDWFGHYTSRMFTNSRWKVVWNLGDMCELYDLEKDPGELTNLFYNKSYCDLRNKYLVSLVEEGKKVQDHHAYSMNLISPELEDAIYDSTIKSRS